MTCERLRSLRNIFQNGFTPVTCLQPADNQRIDVKGVFLSSLHMDALIISALKGSEKSECNVCESLWSGTSTKMIII